LAKIHELIPVEADKVTIANGLVDEAINTFSKKPDHFLGQNRVVQMYDETRQAENTTDRKELVETVDGKLDHVWDGLREAIDVTVTKENSNTSPQARADVVVGGKTVLTDVPATALLALEKRLAHLKSLYQAIPTLDPSYAWEADDTAALPGAMRTKYPQESQKTEKVPGFQVLYEATKEHPAQVREYTMDQNVAKVIVERQSGLISPARKAQLLTRISALATAVKQARQRANMADVIPLNVADDIRSFIHA
jgi:hypothetical protein